MSSTWYQIFVIVLFVGVITPVAAGVLKRIAPLVRGVFRRVTMPPETDKAFEQFDAFMESVLDRLNERDQELAGAHTLIADLRKENAALRRQGGAGVHDTLNDGDSSRRLQDARRRVLRTLHPNATVGLPEEVRVAREEAFKEIWPAFDKS